MTDNIPAEGSKVSFQRAGGLHNGLFDFGSGIGAEQIVWLLAEISVKQDGQYIDKDHQARYYQQLGKGCLLDALSRSHIADLAGTILDLLFEEQRVEHTPQANAKSRFEEQEYKADQ